MQYLSWNTEILNGTATWLDVALIHIFFYLWCIKIFTFSLDQMENFCQKNILFRLIEWRTSKVKWCFVLVCVIHSFPSYFSLWTSNKLFMLLCSIKLLLPSHIQGYFPVHISVLTMGSAWPFLLMLPVFFLICLVACNFCRQLYCLSSEWISYVSDHAVSCYFLVRFLVGGPCILFWWHSLSTIKLWLTLINVRYI